VHARHQHSILRPFKAYLAEEGVFELVLSLLELSSGSSGGGAAVLLLLCLLLLCKVQLDLHTYTEKAQKQIVAYIEYLPGQPGKTSANCHAVLWLVSHYLEARVHLK
jgi:hypothetical protein